MATVQANSYARSRGHHRHRTFFRVVPHYPQSNPLREFLSLCLVSNTENTALRRPSIPRFQTEDGRKFTISKRPADFTRNIPSTFVIPPGESMVYPILLDDQWDAVPGLPIADETPIPIMIRAIYQLDPTPEASAQNVRIGRLESSMYNFTVRHWLSRTPLLKVGSC